MSSFILGSSTLGVDALGSDFIKYKVKIYDGTTWKTYRPIIIRKLTIPANAIIDVNGIPILDNNNEFLLINENTEGLTDEYIYSDMIKYKAYICKPAN